MTDNQKQTSYDLISKADAGILSVTIMKYISEHSSEYEEWLKKQNKKQEENCDVKKIKST